MILVIKQLSCDFLIFINIVKLKEFIYKIYLKNIIIKRRHMFSTTTPGQIKDNPLNNSSAKYHWSFSKAQRFKDSNSR